MPLAERAFIGRIRQRSGRAQGVVGIGDDCASVEIPPGHEVLVTTDFSLQDVHFDRRSQPADSVGHRCLVRGLSDIAAMGGKPLAAFLSLALPGTLPQAWADEFLEGLLKLARQFKIPLAGGDTSKSPGKILADIVVLGSVPKGNAILRSGAKPGDRIFVTGTLGGSATTLRMLLEGRKRSIWFLDFEKYLYPTPRIKVGTILRKKDLASSMIDLSDGLSTDLSHICEESGVGAEVNADAIPRARHGKPQKEVELRFALHGGEDYELLFTSPKFKPVPARIAGIPITQIGTILRAPGIFLTDKGKVKKLRAQGWEHFRK
ncbi:MAG: thiamine-phosphate kinase [Terriglobales bacterium]